MLEKTIKKLLLDTSLTTPFLTFEYSKMVNSTWLGLKIAKNHVQHKIEGFCDQIIVNNNIHQILILLQNNIIEVPLDAWLTTSFLTFKWPKMVNSTCLGLKKSQKYGKHRIEGFCDQSIVKNVLHQILILLQKKIKRVPLYSCLTTTFFAFEWPNIFNST